MKNVKFLALVALSLFVGGLGCDDVNKDIASVNPSTKNFLGTVLGRVLDRCSGHPIAGVKVNLAGKSEVTTNSNGEFVFRDVPVTSEATYSNGDWTYWDGYEVLMDFRDYNKNKPDSLKYPDIYEDYVEVYFADLNDGDNSAGTDGESGSGADTPVDGIVSSMTDIEVGALNTTIMGQVVDGQTYAAAAGATVLLKHSNGIGNTYVVKSTTTDANGNYTFTNVENGRSGLTIEAWDATKIFTDNISVSLTCGQDPMLLTQVSAERLALSNRDNTEPFVTSITPENDADVATATAIVFTFSEPIKQNAYTNTALPIGNNTFLDDISFTYNGLKKSFAEIGFTAAWSNGNTTLTFTPGTALAPNADYTFDLSSAISNFTDGAGNGTVDNADITGDFEALDFTTQGSATAPAAPVVSKDPTSVDLDYTGGNVTLEWTIDESSIAVKEFIIYRRAAGETAFDEIDRTTETYYTDNTGALHTGGNDPRRALDVSYQVRAVSVNLVVGAASNTITVDDAVEPVLDGTWDLNTEGDVLAGNGDYVYVAFSEPIDEADAETIGNYSIDNAGGGVATVISGAVYYGYTSVGIFTNQYVVRLTVTDGSIDGGDVLDIGNGLTDLAGNGIDPNGDTLTF